MSRKQHEEDVKKKLDELAEDIERLSRHLKDIEHELDDEHHEGLAKLKDLQDETRRLFHEMVDAGDEAYDSVRSRMEQYWTTLGREIKAYDRKLNDGND
jgi:predicted nuclease with TOPRIM domain